MLPLASASLLFPALFTWFALGDLSEDGGDLRMVTIPALDRRIEVALACSSAVLCGATFVRAGRRRSRDIRVMAVSCAALGVFVALCLRAWSSATVGANIGGGMLMMAAPFVVLPLAVVAVRAALRTRGAPASARA